MNESKFVKEIGNICDLMYSKGWNERNGGNISYILKEEDINEYKNQLADGEKKDLKIVVPNLKNKYLLVTGTGKYLKNVSSNPQDNLVIIKILEDSKSYKIVWGNCNPTSELPTHLLCHNERLKVDEEHRVIIHNHATNIEALTFIEELTDRNITRILWKMQTESIVVFPEGVGVLPWMLCGGESIGIETAKKMEIYRLVIWSHHGILGSGKSLDEVYGLIETAEKAAEIYLKIKPFNIKQDIKDEELKLLAETFKVNYSKSFLE